VHTLFELEVARVLIQALDLEDVSPEDIAPDAALFGFSEAGSLGLDSIDALEIALAISKNYAIQLKADDENNREIFRSLRSLTNFIQSHRA
jgi:acyl carrier protein